MERDRARHRESSAKPIITSGRNPKTNGYELKSKPYLAGGVPVRRDVRVLAFAPDAEVI